jgi:hypothetical protein
LRDEDKEKEQKKMESGALMLSVRCHLLDLNRLLMWSGTAWLHQFGLLKWWGYDVKPVFGLIKWRGYDDKPVLLNNKRSC